MLDVTYRMSLLPYEVVEPGLAWAEPWAVPLITNGLATRTTSATRSLSAENVLRFLILDAATRRRSSAACARRANRRARCAARSRRRCTRT
jgi:hypothetical protein